jgi:hypothetical protein
LEHELGDDGLEEWENDSDVKHVGRELVEAMPGNGKAKQVVGSVGGFMEKRSAGMVLELAWQVWYVYSFFSL